MSKVISVLLIVIAIGSTLIPFWLGAIGFKRNPFFLKLLFILTGVSLACDLISILCYYLKANVNLAGNAYRIIEFSLLLTIYYLAYNYRKLFVPLIILTLFYLSFFTLNITFLQQEKINSYTNIFSAFVLIPLSLGYFYQLMKVPPTHKINALPMFWINVGVLVYFAGNLFLFTLVNKLGQQLLLYWNFHNLLLILKNIIFAIALYLSFIQNKNDYHG